MFVRVGTPSSQLHQTWDLSSSKLLREVPRTVFALAEAPLRTNDCQSTGFYVRLALAAACSRRKLHSISLHQAALCLCTTRMSVLGSPPASYDVESSSETGCLVRNREQYAVAAAMP